MSTTFALRPTVFKQKEQPATHLEQKCRLAIGSLLCANQSAQVVCLSCMEAHRQPAEHAELWTDALGLAVACRSARVSGLFDPSSGCQAV
jgi:hypothetical protein